MVIVWAMTKPYKKNGKDFREIDLTSIRSEIGDCFKAAFGIDDGTINSYLDKGYRPIRVVILAEDETPVICE